MIRSRINLNKKFSVHLVNTVNTAKRCLNKIVKAKLLFLF